jgi:integrase
MKAWIFQDPKQVEKVGEQKASWYVGWYDLRGKRRCQSCGPGKEGTAKAEKFLKKKEAELLLRTEADPQKTTWADFSKRFETDVLSTKGQRNREETISALDHFQEKVKPVRVAAVDTALVDRFIRLRRKDHGVKKDTVISPATINKELRHLRAVFRKALRWKMLPEMPEIDFLKEAKKLAIYVPPEHFAQLYQACENARLPQDLPYPAADWWRGLLVTAYMTGWRITALLSFRRADANLEDGTAFSQADDNKGKRDQKIALHPLVIEHLQRVPGFDPVFFPWNYRKATLFNEFARIQRKASIKPERGKDHYTFHDLRRAFATMNAGRLTADALQHLMQHKDYQTTQRYISMARQLKPAAQNLFVPDLKPKRTAEG